MKTKYNLEKELVEKRSIVDSVDKVHFREPVHLEFTMEEDDNFPNRGYDSMVIVDLSKSNYFILDLGKFNNHYEAVIKIAEEVLSANPEGWPEQEITDLSSIPAGDPTNTVNIKFINYNDVQRFEILIIKREADLSINWTRPDQDVVFPFGDDKDSDFLRDSLPSQRIVSFRLGKSVNGFQQFIGIMTPWFTSKIYLEGALTVLSSNPGENYVGATCDVYSESLLEDTSDPPKYLMNPLKVFSGVVDGNNKAFFNIFRSYRPVIHITSDRSFDNGTPQWAPVGYLGNILEGTAQEDIDSSITINENDFYKYSLRMSLFRYGVMSTSALSLAVQINKQGTGIINYTFPISTSSSFKLRDINYDLLKEKIIEHFYTDGSEEDVPDDLGGYVAGEIYLFRRLYKLQGGNYVYQAPDGNWGFGRNVEPGQHYTYRKHSRDLEQHLMCKTFHTIPLEGSSVTEPFAGSDWETYWEVIGDEAQSFNYSDLYYRDHISISLEQPFFMEGELEPIKFNNCDLVTTSGANTGSIILEVGDISSVHLTSQIEKLYNIRGKYY